MAGFWTALILYHSCITTQAYWAIISRTQLIYDSMKS